MLVEGIDTPLFGGSLNHRGGSIFTWSGTDSYSKMNIFTLSKTENYWILSGDEYNEKFKNCQGNPHNGQLGDNNPVYKIKTDKTCFKSSGYVNFTVIYIEGNMEIPIKSYKYQRRGHMIRNGMLGIFYLPYLYNKEKHWDVFLNKSRFINGLSETL